MYGQLVLFYYQFVWLFACYFGSFPTILEENGFSIKLKEIFLNEGC